MSNTLVDIKDLSVSYFTYAGEVQSVRGVSFDIGIIIYLLCRSRGSNSSKRRRWRINTAVRQNSQQIHS